MRPLLELPENLPGLGARPRWRFSIYGASEANSERVTLPFIVENLNMREGATAGKQLL